MVFGFLIRAGVVVGAIYYTKKVGVWGTPYETEKLYNNIKNELRPHVQRVGKQLPFDIPALPKTGEIRFLAKHYYNEGVKKTFHAIEMLPCNTVQMISKAKNQIVEFAESPKTSK